MPINFEKLDRLREEAKATYGHLMDLTERWREAKAEYSRAQRDIEDTRYSYGRKYLGSDQERKDQAKLKSLEDIERKLREKRDHAEAIWKSLAQIVESCARYANVYEAKEFGVRQGLG